MTKISLYVKEFFVNTLLARLGHRQQGQITGHAVIALHHALRALATAVGAA